jgi:acyl-CoA thioester hydrolase
MTRHEPKPRAAYRSWKTLTTRWLDNDAYGHVNNAVHYQWFDSAVNAWLIERGLLDVAKGDPIGLVVETGCRYFQSVSYPQAVDIGFAVEKVGRSSIRYRLGVFLKGEDEVIAEGFFVHVLVDRANRRPTPIPAIWQKELDTISEV